MKISGFMPLNAIRNLLSTVCLVVAAIALPSCGSDDEESNEPVAIEDTADLILFIPDYKEIKFVAGERPSQDADSVIMMIGGAFTGALLKEFKPSNVCGSYSSSGVFQKNVIGPRVTGTFTFVDGEPHFYYTNDKRTKEADANTILKDAARRGGHGFVQEMLIHDGKIVPHTRSDKNENIFRAICLLDGKVVVAQSADKQPFGEFIDAMLARGITEAIYTDMGFGWNYGWYRGRDRKVTEIFSIPTPYSSNWIVFTD